MYAVEQQSAQPDAAQVWKPVQTELLERTQESLGSFISDQGWSQSDMDTTDALGGLLAAAPRPPEAAPVVLPKPVGWFHRHPVECRNGEVYNYQIASADKKDGWEEFPLYTEQQVRALLAKVSAPAQKGWCDGCNPDNCCGCGPAAPAK